jgi:2-succinyl-5-enolpyruvyl-6-hydroxy-3-cyclohexene-1-carboxylate synthase
VHSAARGAPEVHAIVEACRGVRRGVGGCGPAAAWGDLEARRAAVAALGRATRFAIFAEATSQLRFGAKERVLGALDTVLRDRATRARLAAEVVIEIGAPPTSSAYATYLAEQPPARRVVIAAHGWNDPAGGATDLVCGDEVLACRAIAKAWGAPSTDPAFADELARAEAGAWRAVAAEIEEPALTEGRLAYELVNALPEGASLVVANSNPVRDLDTYGPPSRRAMRVLHQRGASGIDGLVSGAAGARTALEGPLAVYLGDLAMLHDIGGLAAARTAGGPLAIVVANNAGGRIFAQLPIAGRVDAATLERFFVTPEPLDLRRAADAFGLGYRAARTPAELCAAMRDALAAPAPVVVDAFVESGAAARRARIWRTP